MSHLVKNHKGTDESSSYNLRPVLCLCVFGVLVWLWLSFDNATSQSLKDGAQFETQIKVATNQLPAQNGVIPVEVVCDNAELSAPNALEKLSCVIKNNSGKYISAGTIRSAISLEKDGQSFVQSAYDTFDSFLHQDFREDHKNNLVGPGREFRLNDLPTDYEIGVVITGITVEIDYIEFDDNQTLGPNRGGSRVITNIREGASRYKNWLAQKYKEGGKKVNVILPLLEKSRPLPEELGVQNGEQKRGAIMYRNYARRTYETIGPEALAKHLN